jgi:hypothetical protein
MFKTRPLDPQAAHIEAKLSELTRQNRAKDQEIAKLRKSLKSNHFDAERLPNLRKEFGTKVEELKELIGFTAQTAFSIENRTLVEENQELDEDKRKLQNLLQDLENELVNAKKDRLNANESLRQLRESVFRGQDQPERGTDTHESIADELDILFKDARAWCKSHCIRELPDFSGTIEEWHPEWKSVIRPDPIILKHERLPSLLLHALLMDRIYRQIFAKPFFFLPWRRFKDEGQIVDSEDQGIAKRYQFETFLEEILEEILQGEPWDDARNKLLKLLTDSCTGNPEGGHAWRSQLLRLLDPRLRGDKNERPQLSATKDRSTKAYEEAATHIMEDFVMGSAAPLLCKPSNETQAVAELEHIFQFAVRMAHKLWLRRSSLEIRTLDELPQNFKFDEALLRPHSLHIKALTDDAVAFDGHIIQLVVHPAILVRGKSDGSEYDKFRILKAAVVWMG